MIELPWPPKALHPNSRKRHLHATSERRAFKQTCWALAKHARFRAVHLDMTFHPPDNRKRDLDGMFAAMKYGLDGVAAAMGIDDSAFSFTIRKGDAKPPHGRVVVKNGDPPRSTEIEVRGVAV